MKSCILAFTVLTALCLTGCGGSMKSSTTTPPPSTFTVSVTVTGLSGSGLVLQDNGGDNLSVAQNGTFSFATAVAQYNVTVSAQPPNQTCTVNNGKGNATAPVNLSVSCVSFTVSVTVTGLSGTLVLQDDKSDTLTFTSNTTQTFATGYASGAGYRVNILTPPVGQTCTPSINTTGIITANITVTVTCGTSSPLTLSAMVTGLSGGTLVLKDNVGDTLSFTTNTTMTFATSYTSGQPYTVIGQTQPTGQTCTLSSNATGTITANTTVVATCTSTSSTFTISAAVTGLSGTLKLQDDVGDSLTFTTNTTQTFATHYASGAAYIVSVATQPTGQTCTLGSNSTGTITSNITVTATCTTTVSNLTISVAVTGLTGTLVVQDDKSDTLTFTTNKTQTFATSYSSGSSYTVSVETQPSGQTCTLGSNSSGTITSNMTVTATCASSSGPRPLGTVSAVSNISCSGSVANGVCQQMTVSCPDVPDVFAYVKTNSPTGSPVGTVSYNVGTDGNGLYDSIFTDGKTAVQNVLNAGFTTVQISWGTPFNTSQPDGWVQGPGGVLAAACRYATVTQWIYDNIQNDTTIPMCATGNSGGAGALGYALSQYGSGNVLSMAEVTSGPMTARLDWGCGCLQGKMTAPVPCGSSSSLGTCFGAADSPVWDPAYTPNAYCSQAAVNKILPPGGLTFFLDDSAEAPGVIYNFPKTHVNVVFGGADTSSAIPIAMDWYNNITSLKTQGCVVSGQHSLANTLAGAQQIANDLISMCKLQ